MTPNDPLIAPVPDHYRGVWQRRLLETAHLRDVTTTVFWLQTGTWHADIRIPADRPDFSGIQAFSECSAQQRDWLVRQHGFAGVTQVDGEPAREICRWHHLLDFHPPRAEADAGVMQFGPEFLTETGLDEQYLEHWYLLPDSVDGFAALQLLDADGAAATPAQYLLVAGSYVMTVRNRTPDWPARMQPGTLLTADAASVQPALLDFDISFGRRTNNGWQVLHSTLPWRVGQSVSVRMGAAQGDRLALTVEGVSQAWRILKWSAPNK